MRWIEARDAAKYAAIQRTAPQTKSHPNGRDLEERTNPDLKGPILTRRDTVM